MKSPFEVAYFHLCAFITRQQIRKENAINHSSVTRIKSVSKSRGSRVEGKCRESRVKSRGSRVNVESREQISRVESKKSRVIVESGQMSQEQQSRYILNKICTTTEIISLPGYTCTLYMHEKIKRK